MSHSHHSSNASVSCRLEWLPSRWLTGALVALAVLAVASVLASEMPRFAAWPVVVIVALYAALQVRSYRAMPCLDFVFPGNDLAVLLDGEPVDAVEVQWRGPLAFVTWQDRKGGRRRLSWWPDTLPPSSRRELRLAAGHLDAVRHPRGMAP